MRLLALFLIPISSFLFPALSLAGDYQQCSVGSTCTIGEFLYADDYSALPSQSCTLTVKDPAGAAVLTNQAMTSRADGWYSYDISLDTTTGLYTATMCCVPSDGTLCLDKSFEVKEVASSLTPADIWSYSSRTLTSYGTLVNDIWSASTRTLSSVGSLVSDVWGHSTRTLTSLGSLLTQSDTTIATSAASLSNLVEEQKTQRELLEKLVNTPVISLSLDEGTSAPDFESKLNESRTQASLLYDTLSSTKARLLTLDTKWDRLTRDTALSEIASIALPLQTLDPLTRLTRLWDHPSISTLSTGLFNLKQDLSVLLTETTLHKTTYSAPALMKSISTLSNLETVLGDSTNTSQEPTLFGYLALVEDRNTTLLSENQKILGVLENLNGQGEISATRAVDSIKSRLLTLNQYPGGEKLITPAKVSDDTKLNLKNILFSLQGLIGLNRMQLAVNAGDPIRSLWLEEGSIIFRAVISNPSSIITQSVPLKFYLPREVKTDDIITLDPTLNTTYDSAEEALYAHGTYNLAPNETKIVYVEIEDIWQLTNAEIESLRTQSLNLLKPLEKTAYYSQGIILQSDIDTTLDKIQLATSRATTPENRIRSYREGKLELTKVTTNLNRLQDLVAQSSGTGSLFGFVGGVQTIAVWGIILVVVAGFIFLTLYFKKLGITHPIDSSDPVETTPKLAPVRPGWQLPAVIVTSVILTAGITILLTRPRQVDPAPTINQVATTPSPSPAEIIIQSPKDVLGDTSKTSSPSATLTVPEGSSVNIRNRPSSTADIVMSLKQSTPVYVFQSRNDWRQIGFSETDQPKGYWVHAQFLNPSSDQ